LDKFQNCDSNIGLFSIAPHLVVTLNPFASIFKLAIVGRAITLERKSLKKKQITDTKKDAKRIKSDSFSNREKSNIGKNNDWMAP
jgi:hypothetical protein